ncbi:saccharopine dehydrogenase NADP-binding domain-containing protein [Bacillus sp. NP157]|nr:saccharopine dehydrogenase NADP-binding domain-containing protein [Bacillus sp. NP157]
MKTLMIYGATGYTGRLVAEHALALGVPLLLAGRDAVALREMSRALGVPHVIAAVDDVAALDDALSDVGVLLNGAGPFFRTASPLMEAALRHGVHYIDTSAELVSYTHAADLSERACAAGVMLMPGGGGSVAMLGSLAARAVQGMVAPQSIRLALRVSGPMSRGSAISALEGIGQAPMKRENAVLVERDATDLVDLDFGDGPVPCFPVSLPDLLTVWQATGTPNIETFVHITGQGFPSGDLAAMPPGPSREERLAHRYQAVAEAVDADGQRRVARLDTVNGYTFTAMAAAEAGRRVLAGEVRPGFQTPVDVFGGGFAETIADTTLVVG